MCINDQGYGGQMCGESDPGTHESAPLAPEVIDHPAHYGGDTVYEVIKIIDHYKLGFCLGNTIKYILRAPNKGKLLEDLKKARWYLDREISRLEREEK